MLKKKLQTTLSYQSTQIETVLDSIIQRQYEKPYVRQEQQEDKMSLNSKLTYKLNAKNNINVGLIADYYFIIFLDSAYQYEYDKFLTSNDVQENMSVFQSYAQWQHKFSNSITAYGGLHFQYFNLNKELAVEPRLGLEWQVHPKHRFNLGYGQHSQVQPKTVYFHQAYDATTNTSFTTNEDLKFTKSNHYVLGHNFNVNQSFRIKTEAYYQSLYNVPIKESFPEFSMLNTGADFGVDRQDSLVNEGTGSNYGVEITIEKFLSNGYYVLLN